MPRISIVPRIRGRIVGKRRLGSFEESILQIVIESKKPLTPIEIIRELEMRGKPRSYAKVIKIINHLIQKKVLNPQSILKAAKVSHELITRTSGPKGPNRPLSVSGRGELGRFEKAILQIIINNPKKLTRRQITDELPGHGIYQTESQVAGVINKLIKEKTLDPESVAKGDKSKKSRKF